MKLLFVSGNQEVLPDAVIPLGLLYVMAATPDRHDKQLVDLCFSNDPCGDLAAAVQREQPDVVAIGMRNIQDNVYSGISDNLAHYRALIQTIRGITTAPIVLGGGGFSVMPTELMQRLQPDYGIAGEGEAAFPALLEALEAGESPEGIAGVFHAQHDQVVGIAAGKPFVDMSALAPPDRSLVDRRYYTDFGIDSVQTKRGCPLLCDYCTYPIIEGRAARKRDPELVAREFLHIAATQPDVKHVFVVDAQFNLPVKHAKEVCRALIAANNPLPWTCYANPLGFDAELAELMVGAGCVGMEIGSDSGSDEILKVLRKGFKTDRIREIRRLSQEYGLKDCHTFILGTPGETLDHVRETLDFLEDLDPFAAIVMVWVDDHEALDVEYAKQRRELRSRIWDFVGSYRHQHPRWVIPPMGVLFDERLFRYLRRHGMHGPLWQHIDRIPDRPSRR